MNRTMIHSIVVRGSILSIFLISLTPLKAEETDNSISAKTSPFLEVNKGKMFTPVVAIESWATYSMGAEKSGVEYADRADVSFRRLRFGACGNPYSWLKYSFHLQLDRL